MGDTNKMTKWEWWNFSNWRPLYRNIAISLFILFMAIISTKPFTALFTLLVLWGIAILTISFIEFMQSKINQAKLSTQRTEAEKSAFSLDEQRRLEELERMLKEQNKDGETHT